MDLDLAASLAERAGHLWRARVEPDGPVPERGQSMVEEAELLRLRALLGLPEGGVK